MHAQQRPRMVPATHFCVMLDAFAIVHSHFDPGQKHNVGAPNFQTIQELRVARDYRQLRRNCLINQPIVANALSSDIGNQMCHRHPASTASPAAGAFDQLE